MKEMAQCGTFVDARDRDEGIRKEKPRRERVEPWSAHRSL